MSDLTREQCWALLARQPVGRVVYTVGALPACAPVAYVLDGDAVVFRTSWRPLLVATRDAVVAFEVDSVDPTAGTGWSVLVTGPASPVEDAGACLRLNRLGRTGSGSGGGDSWVQVVPALVTGRLLGTTTGGGVLPRVSA